MQTYAHPNLVGYTRVYWVFKFFSGAFQRANWMMQTISPQHWGEAKPVRAQQGGTASGVVAD